MYAFRRWDEETVIKWLAVAMCLALVGLAVLPAVSIGDLAAILASKGYGYSSAAVAGAGAGLIRVSPEVAMFLVDAGLISCSTGVGVAIGGILVGVGLTL